MATPLKERYGAEVPVELARQLALVYADFDTQHFLQLALDGYNNLELMGRGRHLAACLQAVLPEDYPQALAIVLASTASPLPAADFAMGGFFYLPHTCFVAAYGLDHFEPSMAALNQLTRLFTAEFSIRAFIERYPQRTLEQLAQWALDDNHHVRRLVSEGTRPRLPWAGRLPGFQRDPAPVLALLELLRDDPEPYVQRSVANNLNDIGKDHPALLMAVARRWAEDAPERRQWIIRHALRNAIKQGHPEALAILGFGNGSPICLEATEVTPSAVAIGGNLLVRFALHNPTDQMQTAVVDFRIHYIKANGSRVPKVFKLKNLQLPAGERCWLQKTVSLAQMSTRQHYPGLHSVDLVINGQVVAASEFTLLSD